MNTNLNNAAIRNKFFVIAIMLFIAVNIYCKDYAGVNTAAFLRLVPDAKTASLGRTFTGIADNNAAVFFNPSALVYQNYRSFSFTHNEMFLGIRKEFFALKFIPKPYSVTAALSGLYIDYGNLEHTVVPSATQPDPRRSHGRYR